MFFPLGGSDLIFPHHENEIAQSRCCGFSVFEDLARVKESLGIFGIFAAQAVLKFLLGRELGDNLGDPGFPRSTLDKHMVTMNLAVESGRAAKAPELTQ